MVGESIGYSLTIMFRLLLFNPQSVTLRTSANVIRYPVRRKPVSSVNGSQLRVMHTGVTLDDTIRRSPEITDFFFTRFINRFTFRTLPLPEATIACNHVV